MKTINDIEIKNKRVVLRLDFNVPVENGVIKDNSKIVKSLKTINYLLENNCKVIILSHFGRIKSEEDKLKNSLKVVGKELANLLKRDVKFLDNCYGDKVKNIVGSFITPVPGGVGPMTICSLMKNTLAAGKKEYYS